MIDLLLWIPLAAIPAFMLLDCLPGARRYSAPSWWKLRGLAFTAVTVSLQLLYGEFWTRVLGGEALLDLSGLRTLAGGAVAWLVYELCHYWYHRMAHRLDAVWLMGHQLHHSAERMDAFGANHMHPIDLFFFASIPSLVFFPLLGVTPTAAALAGAVIGFNAMFQHANIRTPHWLGYLIQRPESHCLHHARGRHASNYANLPLWDMLFGTFDNPRGDLDGIEAGFWNGASTRVLDMLRFRDVSRPRADGPRAVLAETRKAA